MKQRSKKMITVSVIAVLLIGVSWWYFGSRNSGETVETEAVRRGDVAQTVSVTGRLEPTVYADLSFLKSGSVDRISVKEGDAVKAGQVVASLDGSVLRSELNAAMIALSIAEENEKLARRGWKHLKPEEREAKKLATEQARETVRSVAARIDECDLVSPITGSASEPDIRVGETAVAGSPVLRVTGEGAMLVEADVPESDVVDIAPGMTVRMTFDALTQQEVFIGTVVEIRERATVSQGVVSYLVKFRLEGSDDRLKESMTANVDIETAKSEDTLMIPFRALSRERGETSVEVSLGEDRYERRKVTIGIEGDDGMIEVRSGLQEGDLVVVSRKQ